MHIAIRSTEHQKQELLQKGFHNKALIQWIEQSKKLNSIEADVYFDFIFNDIVVANNEFINDKPVFVHAVNCICKEIDQPNYIRLNAWNGFLDRPITELACSNNEAKKNAENVFNKLEWNFVFVKDDYGFIAARIIAMIINEAYFALEENVSTKEQIDIAMQLGTNYRYGPFEWSKKIGLKNIFNLLNRLSTQNQRYTISSFLIKDAQQF